MTRIHLEEDAGKSIHDQDDELTFLDYNRAGMPLIEIVSEPDMHTAEEAAAYLTQIRKLVRWIGICDGNMEEGSMRCDANISVRLKGSSKLGTRVEVKNLNSIKHLKHAVEIEIERLCSLIDTGHTILQETRSYDADAGITFSIRTKEDAEDYRYFPEPDLAPFKFTQTYIQELKDQLPLLPEECFKKYIEEYGLSTYDAEQLTEDKSLSELFEKIAIITTYKKQWANTLLGPVRAFLNADGRSWENIRVSNGHWVSFLSLVGEGKISFSQASQKVLPLMLSDASSDPMEVVKKLDLMQDAGEEQIQQWVNQVIASMPDKVAEYKKGKKGLIGLFVGEVKKVSKGKADPKVSTQLLESILNEK
ncbi:MAG: Asp-tRNA(Asn)/Glu-tRNA(Gln) amidotransferase subunit GatB [Chitinophagia bacterium]|nr:Asp-tRNA(Asn)/Glu-tRNA(Gln) amidotransferase subunit GatB [Chitinophagia bacterium]